MAASPFYAPPSGAGYAELAPSQQPQQVTFVAADQSPIVYLQPVQTGASAEADL